MKILFNIKDGKIEYTDFDRAEFDKFKQYNEGKIGIATFEIIKIE